MPKLTVAKCKALQKPGLHGDGGGLYLGVKPGGGRSWYHRIVIRGKRREIGLGRFPDVSLAKARALAALNRATVAEGGDPLADRRREKAPRFRDAAQTVHEANLPRWRSTKHAADWLATLNRHAMPTLGGMTVDAISRTDVLDVLTPIWASRPETARRVRQRIRTVMQWAVAHGYADRNPAGEVIDGALPAMPKVKAHLRALPYIEVPAALELIEGCRSSLAARSCLRFLVLTAARSGTARGALWHEIDTDSAEWRIPGSRMKSGAPHRVPLSDAALATLDEVDSLRDDSRLIFPSPRRRGEPMSDMTLTKLVRDIGLAERTTVHGFRSAFRDWAAERTNAPHAVMELALAHRVGSAVEQAYARSDLLEKRRDLMDQWAEFAMATSPDIVQTASPTAIPMGRLTTAAARALSKPGLHSDGNTLYLRVSRTGSKSWVQRVLIHGRRRDIGLGGFPTVTLAEARTLAIANRRAIRDGRDPLDEKRTGAPYPA